MPCKELLRTRCLLWYLSRTRRLLREVTATVSDHLHSRCSVTSTVPVTHKDLVGLNQGINHQIAIKSDTGRAVLLNLMVELGDNIKAMDQFETGDAVYAGPIVTQIFA